MTRAELRKLARAATAEPDDERQCRQCYSTMHLPFGLEPTPLCNTCAQDTVALLATAYLALTKRVRSCPR